MAVASELASIRIAAVPLIGTSADLDPLIERIHDARFVLLGEASHGTHEFYRIRGAITKRLIAEHGFGGVAVEADWPDSFRVHRFVTGSGDDPDSVDALEGFRRFPTWMWRNADVLDFVGWLRAWNDTRPAYDRAGFYGLDLYSLYASMEAVIAFLDKVDPDAAARARKRYSCFDQFGTDTEQYALSTGLTLENSCENQVAEQLIEMHSSFFRRMANEGPETSENIFSAEQNARVVKNAEEYYRNMFRGDVRTWNLRDKHMTDTLEDVSDRLSHGHKRAKMVVWAHNSHLGDARATEMREAGEWNVGQLVRERHGSDAVLVGFSTFDGTVTAARDWDAPAERRTIRPALPLSWEALFHDVGIPSFMLACDDENVRTLLHAQRLARAIGVVYRPESERRSHYFETRIGDQFDFVLHIDHTRAVEPLERSSSWQSGEMPETYPFTV